MRGTMSVLTSMLAINTTNMMYFSTPTAANIEFGVKI